MSGIKKVNVESLYDSLKKDGEARLNDHAKDVAPRAESRAKTSRGKKKEDSSLMTQYREMKKKHPDALLLFRVGDFYEVLGEDAEKASKILGLDIIGQDGKEKRAGFPNHALDTYLPKLVRAGLRVAICEALEPGRNLKSEIKNSVEKQEGKEAEKVAPEKREVNSDFRLKTVNGDEVTDIRTFQWRSQDNRWFLSASLNGQKLRPKPLDAIDVERIEKGKGWVAEAMMEKYYPTKMAKKVSPDEYQFPQIAETSFGEKLDVQKFNVYKDRDEKSPNYGKWMFYTQVGEKRMSVPGTEETLSAYFDRVETPARLIETLFGERLHLKSHYEQYRLPEGINEKDIRVMVENHPDGTLSINCLVKLSDSIETFKKPLSRDDCAALYIDKVVTQGKLAAKYFSKELNDLLENPLMQAKQIRNGHKI